MRLIIKKLSVIIFFVTAISTSHTPIIVSEEGDVKEEKSAGDKNYKDPVTGMEVVYVEGGCYQMGCGSWTTDCSHDEKPVHEVCVDNFWIGKHEVTQKQWSAVMGYNSSYFKNGDNYPVENVNWYEVQGFIEKLNNKSGQKYRLPTEAEWEYACRDGGKEVMFGTGKNIIGPDEANYNPILNYKTAYSNSGIYRGKTTSVGSFNPNTLGLYDMSGNVWEWVQDNYSSDAYKQNLNNNPGNQSSGKGRIIRGGGWGSGPSRLRCSYRNGHAPQRRIYDIGFRFMRVP